MRLTEVRRIDFLLILEPESISDLLHLLRTLPRFSHSLLEELYRQIVAPMGQDQRNRV